MRWASATDALAAAVVALGGVLAVPAVEPSLPVDCLPDRLVRWAAAQPDPDLRFGAASLPGIVLGPPGDSLPNTGSTSVASLGHGGSAEIEFGDVVIEDLPGPDFIVFENPFFVGAAPASPDDDYQIFVEPGIVEVSSDGTTWFRFPFDAQALADATGANADKDLYARLQGLAGITPTFTGNWTMPNDPSTWDPDGTGGISGAGGDAFDLATVGLSEARFVRITDAESQNGVAGSAEGFDLDAVVVLHGRPRTVPAADPDGDRLSDLHESVLHLSDPVDPDSDGDGTSDGREAAACRDPNSALEDPLLPDDPRLWLRDGACTEARWTFLGTGVTYDLIRGEISDLAAAGGSVDLGAALCLVPASPTVRFACDADPVPPGGFYYLVRATGVSHYGRSGTLDPRLTADGCP
jgi:hypothetical protein